jgi:uncharacterized membrane protein
VTRLALLCFTLTLLFVAPAQAAGSTSLSTGVRKGAQALRQRGCLVCHSLDGTPRIGPSLLAIAGTPRSVVKDGATHTVNADIEYLSRALREPNFEVVTGFPAGIMPRLPSGDEEVADIVAAIVALGRGETDAAEVARLAEQREGSLAPLFLSMLLFVALHFVLSAHPIREPLLRRLGEGPFSLGYSVLVFAAFVGVILGYRAAPYVVVWSPPHFARHVVLTFMPLSLYLLLAGYTTKNPMSAGQAQAKLKLLGDAGVVRGVLRISRHPALCGFALWGLLHLFANGDAAGMIVFAGITTLSIGGMFHQDRRMARRYGAAFAELAARTSRFPFAAILAGRLEWKTRELGIVRPLVAIVSYLAIIFYSHRLLFGVSPLP